PAAAGQLLPPANALRLADLVGQVHHAERRGQEDRRRGRTDLAELLHVPDVRPVGVDVALGRQQVEGGQLEVRDRGDRPAVAAVRLRKGGRRLEPPPVPAEQRRRVGLPCRRLLQGGDRLAQGDTGGRARGGVLLPEQ